MAVEKQSAADEHDEDTLKKNKTFLMVFLALIFLGGGGAGLFFSGVLDNLLGGKHTTEVTTTEKQETVEGEKTTGEDKVKENTVVYFELPDVMANLNPGSATPSFIKTVITLEAPNKEVAERLQLIQPKIQDIVITYVRELRPSDLKGSAGVYRLRDELMLRINKALYPDKINNILFKELLIQ